MYLRVTERRNRDGSSVAYYALAQNVWNAQAKRSEAQVIHNFGRADPALCSWRHWRDSSPVIRPVLAPSLWHEGRTDFVRQVGMAQHFRLSAAARSLSAAKVMRMSDGGVVNVFLRLRWPETDGKPVCPGCGGMICYACPRSPNRP